MSQRSAPHQVMISLKCFARNVSLKQMKNYRPQLISEPAVQDVGDDDGKVKWLGGSSNHVWSKDTGLPISKRQAAKE